MSQLVDTVANTAFSFTLSGNSGISPFLTMFLIGVVGKIQPEYLNFDETMKKIMTSWPSICFWTVMTILESVGKCVPMIDQVLDSAETFIVPVLSTLGTVSSFGSFSSDQFNEEDYAENSEYNEGGRHLRGLSTVSNSSIANATKTFFRVILVLCGMILAISIHFFKMLMRLLGEGCLTQLITVVEAMTVICSVLISIFIRQFAIFVAGCLFVAAGYNAKKRYEKWHREEDDDYVKVDENKPNLFKTGKNKISTFFNEVEGMKH